jgi:transposase
VSKIGKHRTPYVAEFRAHMVGLVKAGHTPEELAREIEPTAQTIINWVARFCGTGDRIVDL